MCICRSVSFNSRRHNGQSYRIVALNVSRGGKLQQSSPRPSLNEIRFRFGRRSAPDARASPPTRTHPDPTRTLLTRVNGLYHRQTDVTCSHKNWPTERRADSGADFGRPCGDRYDAAGCARRRGPLWRRTAADRPAEGSTGPSQRRAWPDWSQSGTASCDRAGTGRRDGSKDRDGTTGRRQVRDRTETGPERGRIRTTERLQDMLRRRKAWDRTMRPRQDRSRTTGRRQDQGMTGTGPAGPGKNQDETVAPVQARQNRGDTADAASSTHLPSSRPPKHAPRSVAAPSPTRRPLVARPDDRQRGRAAATRVAHTRVLLVTAVNRERLAASLRLPSPPPAGRHAPDKRASVAQPEAWRSSRDGGGG